MAAEGGAGGAAGGGGAPGEMDDALSRLASSNNVLQNLIRRLGTGLEDLLPNMHGRARMKEILTVLKEHGNDMAQMEALTELCEILSMGQEDMLIGFSVDAFLPVLVDLLQLEHNPEIMLLSSRAITQLLEVLPKASGKVAASGAIPVFCQRLLTIEFMDVAEQSLLAMHKLSVDHPEPLLRSNGLAATLTFIDFFDTNTQRTAAATAANICRGISSDAFPTVVDMVPNIAQLLSHSDQKICESACTASARLIDGFQGSSEHLQVIAGGGMMEKLVSLLSPGDREGRGFEVSTSTYTQIVKMLAQCCRGSPTLSVMLLEKGIIPTVRSIIKKDEDEGLDSNSLMAVVAVMRPLDQLYHTLMLANELLPPLPSDDRMHPFISSIARETDAVRDLFGSSHASITEGALEAYVASHPETLAEYARLVFPILVDISVTIVNEGVRIKCLSAMAKLFACMPAGDLQAAVKESPVIGYIAGFLTSGNAPVMGLALVMTNMLMTKLPTELAGRFAREGIVQEVSSLCSKESVQPSPCMDALVGQAKYIQEQRFGPGSEALAATEKDELMALAAAAAVKLDGGDSEGLRCAKELLAGENTLSSYQVIKSGLAGSIQRYLTGGAPGALTNFCDVFCEKDKAVEALSSGNGNGNGNQPPCSVPLRTLVSKLNESLSVREQFPVVVSDVSGDLTAGLKLLAQPLKLRLMRDPGDPDLVDYSGNVVLIEPLATINAVEDFLWGKVQQGANSSTMSGGLPSSSLSSPPPASSSASPAASSDPPASASTSLSSPSPVAKGGSATASPPAKEGLPGAGGGGAPGVAASGPPPATPGLVAGGDEDEDPNPADITRPTPSRPAQGQAGGAAPPSGAASAPGASGPSSDHNLLFFVNGVPVPYKSSIIQAVGVLNEVMSGGSGGGGEGGGGGGGGSGRGFTGMGSTVNVTGSKAAWDQVHSLTYRTIRADDMDKMHELTAAPSPATASTTSAQAGAGGQEQLSIEGRCILQERLKDVLVIRDRSVGKDCELTLGLMRTLYVLSRDWFHLYPGDKGIPKAPLVGISDFVSVKVASKLMRQLQDPLMLSTGSLPPWCAELIVGCHFLFPIECRDFYTGCTAFGISRALHSMQQRVQGSSPSDRPTEVRIGRIQRQKIRVSRGRLLTSAMRALELYAGHRSMIEVEYYGEAGTGLGPTLEFYTLVSQELQASRLGLWRDSALPQAAEGEKEVAVAATSPTDGLTKAPAHSGHIKGFHNVCVLRCEHCTTVTFLRCEKHSILMTARRGAGAACAGAAEGGDGGGGGEAAGGEEAGAGHASKSCGGGACAHCEAGSGPEIPSGCSNCGAAGCMKEEWWMLSDEEAAYLASAYPEGEDSIEHIVLQCPECMSVNFPGTEKSLVVNQGGRMTSVMGKLMLEEDYRAVTRHVSDSCTDMPLTQVPVRLTAAECSAAAAMAPKTPVAEEAADRDAGEDVKYVYAPNGLFPCPIPQGSDKGSSVISHFVFMGRLVGKALLDQRHVDLPLAPPFFKKIVGRRLAFEDLELIDPSLHSSLIKMRSLAAAFKDAVDAGRAVADLEKVMTLDGCSVADLCLDFTMPGKPEMELVQGGKDRDVTLENLGEYAEAVARMTLETGVSKQFAAFESGFNEVFPIRHLRIFSPEELEQHIRGDVEPWSMETLRAAIKPDHGYQDSSMPIVWLMTIMSEMDKKERRLFMRFISGSPTLPSGGLKKLQPRLTVVRKDAESPLKPDDYLPSVMTCANYLKMPQYSSIDVMRERLFVAMREGQLCFLLS